MNKEELIKEYDEKAKALRDEFISKLEDDKKEFVMELPEDCERLYFIDNVQSTILSKIFNISNINDVKRFENGLFFETTEEAKQHLKECKLLFTIKKWAKIKNGFWVPDWSDYSNNKFLIYYDGEDELLRISAGSISNTLSNLPTFKTREIAQECIDLFGDKIKEVLC